MNKNSIGLLYAGFTALLWGFLAIALKVALQDLNPVTVVWFRFTVAFVLLLFIMLFADRSFIKTFKKPPWLLILAAFFLGMNYFGFITGIHYTSPSSAQVFIQVGPVILGLSGIFLFKEKLTWKHITGFLMLIAGFIIFYSQQVNGLLSGEENFTKGMFFVIFGGISWSVFSITQKILVRTFNPNHLNLFIYGFATLMFLPFVDFSMVPALTLGDWLLLVFLGLNTLLAYGSLALALKYTEANKISVIITLNPIITFITMAVLEVSAVTWIAYENFTFLSLLGAAIVFGGAVLVITSRRGK
ncbi:MAG: DMT family transporter [Bacteroidales bacterium]